MSIISSEDDRIAERLRSVESGGDGEEPEVNTTGDRDHSGRTGGDDPDDAETSIAERLETAVEYEERVRRLRAQAREEAVETLSGCFKQDVDVTVEPTGEGTMTGVVRIPRLETELSEALDAETDVEVSPIEVTLGALSDPDDQPDQ